jgi:hypothetical protein
MSGFNPDSLSVETPTEYDDDVESSDSIELEIEGLSKKQATQLCQQLSLFVETHDTDALGRFGALLKEATSDQPRSVVRQRFDGGERKPGLEWHTDTDANLTESSE